MIGDCCALCRLNSRLELGKIYYGGGKVGSHRRFLSLNSPQIVAKNRQTCLDFPPASLRSPKSYRLLTFAAFRGILLLAVAGSQEVIDDFLEHGVGLRATDYF